MGAPWNSFAKPLVKNARFTIRIGPIETYIKSSRNTAETQMRVCMFFSRFSCSAFFRDGWCRSASSAP